MNGLKFPRVTEYFGKELSLDDFEHIETLGKGTFGHVALYMHRASGKEFAIKRIQLVKEGKKSNSPEEIELITRKELEILYTMDNPQLIRLIDHFEDN
jgi:serine/threonine protein kinase